MGETANVMSSTASARVIDMMNMLDDDAAAAVIPAIRAERGRYGQIDGENPDYALVPAGYAVMRDGALAGFLEAEYAGGYNFLTNRVKSRPVSVSDESGNLTGFEIVSGDTRVSAEFHGDELRELACVTSVHANIAETHSGADIFTDEARREMSGKISDVIRGEMERVLERSFEFGLDCARLGERVRASHPIKWRKIEADWREIYPSLKITITVDTEIMRVYSLREPNGSPENGREGAASWN
jgi:hypothetical protein